MTLSKADPNKVLDDSTNVTSQLRKQMTCLKNAVSVLRFSDIALQLRYSLMFFFSEICAEEKGLDSNGRSAKVHIQAVLLF